MDIDTNQNVYDMLYRADRSRSYYPYLVAELVSRIFGSLKKAACEGTYGKYPRAQSDTSDVLIYIQPLRNTIAPTM